MGRLGADPLDAVAWADLPLVAHLSTIAAMLDGLADPQFDRVVVDCGSSIQARQLVETPAILLRLLDSALTPRLAMWRFPGEAESDPTVFEALSDARSELQRMNRALMSRETVMRVVAGVDDEQRCQDAASMFGVLGVASEVWLDGTRLVQVPRLAIEVPAAVETGNDYLLDLALSSSAAARARVGRLDEDLVVEFDGVHRWLPLPPVLIRCRAADATRTAGGLRVRFTPDPSLWREPAGSAA